MRYRYVTIIMFLLAVVLQTAAQALKDRYNRQRPVLIVYSENPPYEFENENGEPAGINVDVMKVVMEELGLSYSFAMKEPAEARSTFESGKADLILSDRRSFQTNSHFISENVINFKHISGDSIAEIHFIGRDRQLMDQLDDQYSRLKQSGGMADIQERWIHPERIHHDYTRWAFYIAAALLLAAICLYLLSRLVRNHVSRVTRNSTEVNEMISRALHMGDYDVMLYDLAKNRFTNQYGKILPEKGLTLEEYTQRILPDQREEFTQKMRSMMEGRERHFILNKRWNQGTEEKPCYLDLQGHAICETNDDGRPAYVINAVNDVTHEVEVYRAARDIVHKYEAILSDPFVPMSFYDNKGTLIDHNDAMKNLLYGINDSLFKEIFKPQERKDQRFTRHLYYPEFGIDKYVECHIQPLYNAKGKIANYLVTTNSAK